MFYDVISIKFASVNPKAADAPNWTPYRYAFNNPVRIIDPDGQFETKFGDWLYNASQGFKGKVHKSQTRPGEYYVGRQIKSSNEARYDIKWSGNSERPGGGLINALDKTPQLAKTLKKHVSNVLPSPTRGERSGDFGAHRDEFNLHLGLLFSKGRAKNINNRISYLECLKIVKKVKSPAIHVAF